MASRAARQGAASSASDLRAVVRGAAARVETWPEGMQRATKGRYLRGGDDDPKPMAVMVSAGERAHFAELDRRSFELAVARGHVVRS